MEERRPRAGDMILGNTSAYLVTKVFEDPPSWQSERYRYTLQYLRPDGILARRDMFEQQSGDLTRHIVPIWPEDCEGVARDGTRFLVSCGS